jgi:hypothetical protein
MRIHCTVGGAAALLLIALATPAAAQQPTAEQQNAIRQNCRPDFMANCSGVQPGGRDALQCLQRNASKLSAGCQGALAAIAPPAAPAAPAAAASAPPPAVTAAPAAPATAPARTQAAAPPAAAAPRAAAAPTPQQRSAIQQACRSDFMANCSGVQPGGAQALQCLQRNSASLSPACQGAVAAISGGGAGPATAAAPPPAADSVAAPMPAVLPPRIELMVVRSCRPDLQMLCAGVPPGGGRLISCLAQNEAQVSPTCKMALAEARRF